MGLKINFENTCSREPVTAQQLDKNKIVGKIVEFCTVGKREASVINRAQPRNYGIKMYKTSIQESV